ncbi:MAG: hypothetical protein ACI9WL_001281 [Rubritalea sp.]|jgi:hypothetical protein
MKSTGTCLSKSWTLRGVAILTILYTALVKGQMLKRKSS